MKLDHEITVSFGIDNDEIGLLNIDGIDVGGILRSIEFKVSQYDLTQCNIEIFCKKFRISDLGCLYINDVAIDDPTLIEEICQTIFRKYGHQHCYTWLENGSYTMGQFQQINRINKIFDELNALTKSAHYV